jgi:hypothetical protein
LTGLFQMSQKKPDTRKITWKDARGGQSNWCLYDPADYTPAIVTTIGQVFKETEEYIVLLSSFYEDSPNQIMHHNGVLILKCNIIDDIKLKG